MHSPCISNPHYGKKKGIQTSYGKNYCFVTMQTKKKNLCNTRDAISLPEPHHWMCPWSQKLRDSLFVQIHCSVAADPSIVIHFGHHQRSKKPLWGQRRGEPINSDLEIHARHFKTPHAVISGNGWCQHEYIAPIWPGRSSPIIRKPVLTIPHTISDSSPIRLPRLCFLSIDLAWSHI